MKLDLVMKWIRNSRNTCDMIFDTDILSIFGKIGKISVLKKIFKVVWYDIVDILRLCFLKHIMDERELRDVIRDIEIRDKTYISKKERIFENDL